MPRPNLAELDPPSLRRSPKMLDISSFDLDPAVPRPTRDRADNLVASLKRATALVERTVHDTTPFATLSLALFGKVVHELDHVVQLVEAAAAVEATGERDSLPVRVEESRPTRRSSKVHEPVGHKREIGHEEQGEEQGEERASRPPRHEGESNEHDQPRRREGRPRDEQRDEPVVAVDQPRDRRDALERLSHDGRVHRPSSSHARRDEAPPHNRARVDRVPSRPASATPASPISSPVDEPADKRRSISRAASRLTSRVVSPPPPSAPPHDEPGPPARRHIDRKATRSAAQSQPCSSSPDPSASRRRESSSARPKSRASSAAPRRDDYKPRDLRSSPLDGPATRPKSRTSTSTASSRRAPTLEPLPPRRSSSRSRFVADSSASDDDELVRRRTHVDEGDEPASQPRSRSKARLAARSSSGRSDDARRALELASAPPPRAMGSDSDDEGQARRPSSAAPAVRPAVLTGARVAAAVVRAVEGGPGGGKQELATLSLVSSEYREPSQAALYRVVAVTSTRQLDLFLRTIESAPSLGALVRELKIQPLDADLPTPQPEPLIDPLRRLLNRLPNLTSLDEDFTAGDWDVGDLSTGRDYLLTVLSPCNLVRFRSAKAWFEIGALFALLQTQPQLVELVIGGAAMDRDWVGTKLLATLASSSSSPAPAALLESIEIGQVMHEDTLAVLLRATGGDSVGRLSSVRIGFQSLGASDDDTPLASVPAALALVGSTVTHLALAAPRKASDDSSALLDEVVAVLPRLEVLEWTEATDLAPLALAKPTVLVRLPSSLRVLRARSLVSLSTSAVLSFLHGDAPRALEVLDVQWAHGSSTAEDLAKEPWFKPRHIARIEDAAAELGIECRVGKGDEALAFGRA
ncbi:uncharacterized protein RHOBADRAFT_54998 [Rhodotorula graminis WP1]|uniref:Proteophosphoglycan ppg4 n=1 Tax=Rhodotorula graminis (strain WP1) TaxID=578459 RepID=A0A0P9F143_RHOGW|nr:uncharacterized protein RHOBADRAFT_54998 [Rhodotorula graminis WP1]KPV73222.1 hypothetical protein RHOBADRAFT_54998 [Rhodotorula graminis WP1]